MSDALQQVFDLELEGIVFMYENALDQGFLLVAQLAASEAMLGGTLSVDADILIGIIEQNILIALSHRQRADLLLRGPAGSDRGQAATGKPDLHVRHIFDIGRYRGAHGANAMRAGANEIEHDVEVMNHQVEHDPIVFDTCLEGTHAPALDENRVSDDVF